MELNESKVVICSDIAKDIKPYLKNYNPQNIFILTDDNTLRYCFDIIKDVDGLQHAKTITIKAGDEHKNLEAIADVWGYLTDNGADRHSLLINLGGGMVTDLGGFAASTFKRGIDFINIPTTLLSIVDAAVGGKTGINFKKFKNEIGVIRHANVVLVDTIFLETIDHENFLSGYAEMIKHGLISNEGHWSKISTYGLSQPDLVALKPLVGESIQVKAEVVKVDPYEKGIRKSLNLGHTIGHAFESFAMISNRPVLHGYAVAWGLVSELYLSHVKMGFPKDLLDKVLEMVNSFYGAFKYSEGDFETLYNLMLHDKKNKDGRINFTLMKGIGKVEVDVNCTIEEVYDSLRFYLKSIEEK